MDLRLKKNDSRGSSAVEFALVLPLLLLLIFGLIDFGRLFFVQISLEAMSREVVRASAMTLDSEHCTIVASQQSGEKADCEGTAVAPAYLKSTILSELQTLANSVSPGTVAVSTLGEKVNPSIKVLNACSPLSNQIKTSVKVSTPFKWITPMSLGGMRDMTISSTGVMRCSG